MSRFDAIVLGGGINGLIAAGTLAKRGKSVCLVEGGAALGGMATFCREGGPPLAHLLYNLSPRALREIGLSSAPVALTDVSTVALCPTGRHVILDNTVARYIDGVSHEDAAASARLIAQLAQYGALLRRLAEAPPPSGDLEARARLRQLWTLARFGLDLRRFGKREMRRFLQVLLSNAADFVLDEIRDGPLAGAFCADAIRGAAAGPRSPGTVFGLIYRSGHGGVVQVPSGGMAALIERVAAQIRTFGAEIVLDQKAEDIRIDKDRVAGVTLADGHTHETSVVLSSIGPRATATLSGLDHFDIEVTRRLRNLRARGTCAKIHLKLDTAPKIPGLTPAPAPYRLLVAPSVAYVERAFDAAKYGEMSAVPVIEAVLVPGTDPGTQWLSLIVQYAPSDLAGGWTEAAKAQLLRHTLDALAPYMPDLSDHVTETQIITPDEMEAATGAAGGHWHHAELSLDQVLTLRPAPGHTRYRMGPKGLFLCGAAAHPGGDVMGLAGRNAALAALESVA